MTFAELLEMATDINCSDIHITVGTSLALRRFGELRILEPAPSAAESKQMIYSILSEDQRRFVDAGNDLDVGVMLPDAVVFVPMFTISVTIWRAASVSWSRIFLPLWNWDFPPQLKIWLKRPADLYW